MRAVLFGNVTAWTDDEVADVLLEYASAVARYGRHEVVRIPVLVDGGVGRLDLVLHEVTSIGALRSPVGPSGELPGARAAAAELRARLADLIAPPIPVGADLQEMVDVEEV